MLFHTNLPNITIGYHGCDQDIGESLLAGQPFEFSNNKWDWLGPGIYFWESNPRRAMSFIKEQQARRKIDEPFVVGAAFSLGNCIDTLSENCLEGLQQAYQKLKILMDATKTPMPVNKGGSDLLLRELDCAVINTLHSMIKKECQPTIDSLRGLYHEGGPLYLGSGFYRKSHVQICITNIDCIKGVFRVKTEEYV